MQPTWMMILLYIAVQSQPGSTPPKVHTEERTYRGYATLQQCLEAKEGYIQQTSSHDGGIGQTVVRTCAIDPNSLIEESQ